MVICLLAFGFVNPGQLCLVFLVEMIVSTIWNVIIIYFYNRIFQPWEDPADLRGTSGRRSGV